MEEREREGKDRKERGGEGRGVEEREDISTHSTHYIAFE